MCQLEKNKQTNKKNHHHNLKVENYVLFSGLQGLYTEDLSPGSRLPESSEGLF